MRARLCFAGLLALAIALPARSGSTEALQAGGLERLPLLERTAPVPLVNGAFEEGEVGWKLSPPAFSVLQTEKGERCLRFDGTVPTQFVPSARLVVEGIRSGMYCLRFRTKLRDIPKGNGAGRQGVRVSLEYFDAKGQRYWPSTSVMMGSHDWQPVTLWAYLPGPIRDERVTISVHRYGNPLGGEAFFDDFSLERVAAPPIEAYLRYPNYRGYLPADGRQTVRLWVRVNEAHPRERPQIVVSALGTKKEFSRIVLRPEVRETVVEINARRWPLGRYAVRARLGEYEYPAYLLQKISAEQRRKMAIWFDEHQVLHLRGRPTFLLGFFNAQGDDGSPDFPQQPYKRLDLLAQAQPNFTIDYASWPLAMNDRRAYHAQLQQRGLCLLDTVNIAFADEVGERWNILAEPIGRELLPGEGGKPSPLTEENMNQFLARLAQEMRRLPSHGGWYVMDERGFDRVVPTFQQYTVLRRADPDHPTYGVSDKPDEVLLWRDTLDVFGLDPYPLANMALDRPLTMVGEWTRTAVEATQGSRPIWMCLQFFQMFSKDRWPTEEELRTMSLMALTEGARGLWYWSFGLRGLKSVKDAAERREYWQRAVAVCTELRRLEPALIAPDAPHVVTSVSDPRIRWRARVVQTRQGERWYILAYLPANRFKERFTKAPVTATFTLKNGQRITRSFSPDTADWFVVEPKHPTS